MQNRERRTELTTNLVIANLKEVLANAMQLREDGIMQNHNAALKALELLDKHLGMFSDRTKHEHVFQNPDGSPLSVVLKTIYVSPAGKTTEI